MLGHLVLLSSSADGYELRVFGPDGSVLHSELDLAGGGGTSAFEWTGQGAVPGELHAFRVRSFREGAGGRAYLSETERLAGTFVYEP